MCVAYVYIRYNDRAETTIRSVLEVLVRQIVERHPTLFPIVYHAYVQHVAEGTQPSELQLLELLRELVAQVTATFVLDALDEALPSVQLGLVKQLASLDCKIFITSRELKAVQVQFPGAQSFTVAAQDGDLDLLIEQKLSGSADLQALLNQVNVKEDIVKTVKRKSGGM